jgi:hypothetical protein
MAPIFLRLLHKKVYKCRKDNMYTKILLRLYFIIILTFNAASPCSCIALATAAARVFVVGAVGDEDFRLSGVFSSPSDVPFTKAVALRLGG